ncbi:MAG: glycosyltransferase family 4 protein [Rubrivivax sp.]|nr:glycosyltransferase family 4 protein [Rubrivivax sp.]
MSAAPGQNLRVLLEMRPALDGHSGIPQETRLLFRGLSGLEGIEVIGLLQSGNLVLEKGLPLRNGRLDEGGIESKDRVDRLSRVVVSLQQGAASHRLEHWRKRMLKWLGPASSVIRSALGGSETLTAFLPASFEDFVWRGLFAKSLPPEDFAIVMRGEFRVMRWPWSVVNAIGVASGYLGHSLYPRLDTSGHDVLLVETPYPGRPSGRTRLVVRYHDAIPLLMPHTVKHRGYHRTMHLQALRRNAADGAWFACVSEATRQDLLSVLPAVEPRTITIPNMISHHFHGAEEPADRIAEIIWSRRNRHAPHDGGAELVSVPGSTVRYLLMVSTIEPRKNHAALLDAWELIRSAGHADLQLVCVGALGWDHDTILERFRPWLRRGGLHLLQDVPAADLRLLYRHALVTVSPSFGEGFDFSGVEAMRSGGIVAASDIRVHREVYDDAAEYFSPYAVADMASVIGSLISPDAAPRRAALKARGAEVAARYLPERILPRWREFLEQLPPR